MYKAGDLLVYRRDVCKVIEVKKKYFNNTDYYVLGPLRDKSLKMQIPVDSDLIRNIITKNEVNKIIRNIPNIPLIDAPDGNDKLMEQEYKNLLATGRHEDLVRIIKTTFSRNEDRINNKKKIGEKDDNYFKMAEELLYSEFMVVLDKTYDETKDYVLNKVEKLVS